MGGIEEESMRDNRGGKGRVQGVGLGATAELKGVLYLGALSRNLVPPTLKNLSSTHPGVKRR